jgi:hypothetical protein
MEKQIEAQAREAANRWLVARRDGVEAAAVDAIRAEAAKLPPQWRRVFLERVAYSALLPMSRLAA